MSAVNDSSRLLHLERKSREPYHQGPFGKVGQGNFLPYILTKSTETNKPTDPPASFPLLLLVHNPFILATPPT